MRTSPIWLLDVDGVLNAVTRRPDRSVWDDWRHGDALADGVAWPICWSPSVTSTVARLHGKGLVEVRWLTTWADDANDELRRLLCLPRFDIAGWPPHRPRRDPPPGDAVRAGRGASTTASHGAATPQGGDGGWWKLRAVQDVVAAEPERALLWTDDDLPGQRNALTWVSTRVPRRLVLAPPPHLGITPGLLRQIRIWLGDLPA